MDLTNYIPKGDLKGIDIPIIKQMLIEQVAQGNPEDVTVFERDKSSAILDKGFNWDETELGYNGWEKTLINKDFTDFDKMYPESKNIVEQAMKITSKDVRELFCVRKGIVTKPTKPYPKMMLVWDIQGVEYKYEIQGEFDNKYLQQIDINLYYAWNFAKDIEEND